VTSYALIVEDDLDTGSLYGHILEFMGFRTEIIRSGEQALTHLRQTVPTIVLLDMHLTHQVSGANILDYIRNENRLNKTRVIIITGYPNLSESYEMQADMILFKPISAKQLSTMVLRLCPDHVSENFLYNASHDPLTGLMNTVRFRDRVEYAIRRSKRVENLYFGIVFLQVRNLTNLKEILSQQSLNEVLVAFVNSMREQVRDVDTFSRLSEDKFALLLENIQDPENINLVTNRIRAMMVDPFHFQGENVVLDLGIEVASTNLLVALDKYLGL
jgi:diguanylate cyclase (GGDEF)-like protein